MYRTYDLLSLHNPMARAARALGRDTCQASMTRMCARLKIRTGRLAHTYVASRKGARSASEMQFCWLDKRDLTGDARLEFLRNSGPAPEMQMERAGQ